MIVVGQDAIGTAGTTRSVQVAGGDSLADAIAAAVTLNPTETDPVVISVLDAGVYGAGGLVIPTGVILDARHARIEGDGAPTSPMFTLEARAKLLADWIVPRAGQGAILAANTAGIKRVQAGRIDVTGAGAYGAVNAGGAQGVLYYDVDETRVGASATGIGDISIASGHQHVRVGDVYLVGAGATGIARLGDGTTVCFVQHVIELVAGGTAFNAWGGTIHGFAIEVTATTPKAGAGTTTILLPDGSTL